MLRDLDIWRCAIVRPSGAQITQADLTPDKLVWLPQSRPFSFRADPFGIWDGDQLCVFVEQFDYRSTKGVIEALVFDCDLNLVDCGTVLERPWHLSYPCVFRAEGEVWMLPEARRSGKLILYRARALPDQWEEAAVIAIDPAAVDATPLFHAGRWWLFYGCGGRNLAGSMELNIAFADRLTGPWIPHPGNPVRRGLRGRPAGLPQVRLDGTIDLPLQDSTATYGGKVHRLSVTRLDPVAFEAEESAWLEPSASLAPYGDGLHTLNMAGDVALIDCKRIDRSLRGTLARQRGRIARRFK